MFNRLLDWTISLGAKKPIIPNEVLGLGPIPRTDPLISPDSAELKRLPSRETFACGCCQVTLWDMQRKERKLLFEQEARFWTDVL